MADNLLAIDIHDDCVSGVLLELGQKVTVIRGYGVVSMRDDSLSEAIAGILGQTGFRQGDCRISIGAAKVLFRNLVLPFADARQIAKVLPFELEELTSRKIGDLHLDFLASVNADQETEIVAAMVERGEFVDTLAQLAGAGLDPEIFAIGGLQTAAALAAMNADIPAFVLFDISFTQATLIVVDGGRIRLVRSLGVDAEATAGFHLSPSDAKVSMTLPEQSAVIVRQLIPPVQQTLLSIGRADLLEPAVPCFVNGSVGLYPTVFELLKQELVLEVLPCNLAEQRLLKVEPADDLPWNPALMNRALALALWKRSDSPILNFRKGEFRKQPSLKNLRKGVMAVAIPLAIICVGLVGFFWWEYNELAKRRDVLRDEVVAVFQETLPEVTRVVNPVQQLQAKIAETADLYSSGTKGRVNVNKLTLLAELSSHIPEALPIRITRLVADQNDVRILAETSDFNTVDNVKRELEKSDIFRSVVISSANLSPKGGEVRFELKLEYR